MEDFNIKGKEFIGVIIPDTQNSVSRSSSSYLQYVPNIFNASFDPAMRSIQSNLTSITNNFVNAIRGISPFIDDFDSVTSFFTNGASFPNSPIDTEGGGNRYLVHIPDLMPFINSLDGIWVYNGVPDTQANKNHDVDELIYGDFFLNLFGNLLSNFKNAITNDSDDDDNDSDDSNSTLTSTGWSYFNNASTGRYTSRSTTLDYNTISSFQVFNFIDDGFLNYLSSNDVDPKYIEATRGLMLLAQNAKNPSTFSEADKERIIQSIRGVDEDQLNEYLKNYYGEWGVYPVDFNLLLSNGYDLDNIADYLEGVNTDNLTTDTEYTDYDIGSSWDFFISIDDVINNLSSISGNTKTGALGMLTGGFLNFSLKCGATLAPNIGDTNSGEYKPLAPGTKVLVRFTENDYNSGQIVRVLPYDTQLSSQYSNYKSTSDDLEELYPSLYQK